MSERQYYSVRTGKNPAGTRLDLPALLTLFISVYHEFESKGYFEQAFGYICYEQEGGTHIPGTIGSDLYAYFLWKLRKSGLWPIYDGYQTYTEDDLFDVIELLHDHVSKPVKHYYCKYYDSDSDVPPEWHWGKFDRETGRHEYRVKINELLREYGPSYELSAAGEILTLATPGMEELLATELPEYDPENVENRVDAAVQKFRLYRSTTEDRREAVRALVDVLEFLQPQIKKVLTRKDEHDLFNIANNFGLRHHNEKQKTDYDPEVWLNWMFYFFLATIHAAIELIKKRQASLS